MGGSMDFTSTFKVTKVSEQDDQQQGKLSVGDYVVINESCATYYGQLINILPETDVEYERYIVQRIHLNVLKTIKSINSVQTIFNFDSIIYR
jgi:hypothetical protein